MPIVTLTTDFGLADHYVAAMKAAILRQRPVATLVDVSHLVPAQDVLAGAFVLERAVAAFDAGTIHLAVVDPGVGTGRRLIVARIRDQFVVCPDNGLITWAVRRMGVEAVREIAWRPENLSSTFHGRDVMAPVAGRLAAGESLDAMTCSMGDPVLLPVDMARRLEEARVIYIDHYGNAVTNVPGELVGKEIETVRTYADVEIGKPLALINSSGLLEIAVRNGSAAEILGLKVGSEIQI